MKGKCIFQVPVTQNYNLTWTEHGRSAVFTGDATRQWSAAWVASDHFGSFWRHIVRAVARPTVSPDFDARIVRDGAHARLIVDATGHDGAPELC